MQKTEKYLLETDILAEHLTTNEVNNSLLIRLMKKGICFTTVLNAAELLYSAKNKKEINAVFKVLNSIKVLGLNSRYALEMNKYSLPGNSVRDALFSVVAEMNNLPVVTFNIKKYKNSKLKIINTQKL